MSDNKPRGSACGCNAAMIEQHFRAAGVEFLKGLRLLIDTSIQELEPKPKTGSKITVE